MPFIGQIWDLINITLELESSCSNVRIFNDKIHTSVICKEENIRPNVRDKVIDKDQEKQWSQIDPCGTQGTRPSTGSSPQAEQHVAVDQLSIFLTIEVVDQKHLYI